MEELGNPLFPAGGQEEALSSQFCLFLKLAPAAVPASAADLPGEGTRASLSSGGCWESPEPQTVVKGKEAEQDLVSTGSNRS